MNRLTDDNTAEKLREVSDKLKAGGFEVDISNERYIKLAEYERINSEPEELRKYIDSLYTTIHILNSRIAHLEKVLKGSDEI